MTKNALLDPNQDRTWREIIDNIAEQLSDEDIPERVIEATELLLSGYPLREAAQKVGVAPSKIQGWIKKYPQIAVVLSDARNSLIRWRMNQLDKQFLKAIQKSDEILDLPLSGGIADPKILSAIGQHIRYLMGIFTGQRIDVHVTHGLDDTLLHAKQNALQYLAEQLMQQAADEEPIDVTYRVIDKKTDSGPLLNEEGNPRYGQLGKINQAEETFQCHICGKYYKWLQKHIISAHEIDTQAYELTFMLEPGSLSEVRPDKNKHDK